MRTRKSVPGSGDDFQPGQNPSRFPSDWISFSFDVSTQPPAGGGASDFELVLFALYSYQEKLVSLLKPNRDDDETFQELTQDIVGTGELITQLAHLLFYAGTLVDSGPVSQKPDEEAAPGE